MATDLAHQPTGPDRAGAGRASTGDGRDDAVVDLTELHLHPAPEAVHVAGLMEVEPPPRPVEVERLRARDLAWAVGALLLVVAAPLAVLIGVLALPLTEPVQGVLVVLGWSLLAAAAHNLEGRRR